MSARMVTRSLRFGCTRSSRPGGGSMSSMPWVRGRVRVRARVRARVRVRVRVRAGVRVRARVRAAAR
eukprot:scaffold79093_cov21-Phaeocystis_antarctica.AAC.1